MQESQRERSFWGWGWADRIPDEAGRANLAQLAAGMLGFPAPEPQPMPSLAQAIANLHAPALELPEELGAFCSQDPEARLRHCYGRSFADLVRGFRGDFSPAPDIIATPHDETQIETIYRWAQRADLAVVPYGGGTSVVGGVEADRRGYAGSICVDMRRFDRVLKVDVPGLQAHLQAGMFGPQIERALAPHNLTLRHYPQSFEFSTLGGWLATRSGGHFATVYTHIDDFCSGLRVVSPAGTSQTRRLPATGAGPDPRAMWLGSEGAFGIITEAWMRLQHRPRFRAKATLRFDSFDQAVAACREIAQTNLHPSNCRLLDRREAMLHNVVSDGSCVLLLGFESARAQRHEAMMEAIAIGQAQGGRCPDGGEFSDSGRRARGEETGERWRNAFFDGPYLQSALVSLGLVVDTFETACSWEDFPALHQAIVSSMRERMKTRCGAAFLSCRFTHVYPDGPAPYYTFICPSNPAQQLEHWQELKTLACDLLMEHGATITHHHAVGRLHRQHYADHELPPLQHQAFQAIKKTLDPGEHLNPGVLLPHPRQS